MRTLCISTMLIWLVLVGWFRETRGRWVQLMDVRNKLHRGRWGKCSLLLLRAIFTEGRGTSSIFVLRRYLLFITRRRGGGEERRRFGGSHGFHCCQRVYRRDFELTTKKGGGGGVIRMLQNFMGDQVNFNDTTKILQPSPGDKYWTVT